MDCTSTEEALVKCWQYLQLKSEDSALTTHQRADYTRQLMELPRYSSALKLTQLSEVEHLTAKLAHRYSSIVDDPTGVNNYAEGALALNEGRRNDSKLWSSSLTKDRLFQMDAVKKFIKHTQVAKENLVPKGKENIVLFKREKSATNSRTEEPAQSAIDTTGNSGVNSVQDSVKPEARRVHLQPQPLFKKSENTPPKRKFNFTGRSTSDQIAPEHTTAGAVQPTNTQNSFSNRMFSTSNNNNAEAGRPNSAATKPFNMCSSAGRPTNTNMYSAVSQPSNPYSAVGQPSNRYSVVGQTGNSYNAVGQSSNPYSAVGQSGGNNYRSTEPQKRPYSDVEPEDAVVPSAFKTAREQLHIDQQKKYSSSGRSAQGGSVSTAAYGTHKKSLGTRRGLNSKFVPPVMNRDDDYSDNTGGGGGALVRRAGPAGRNNRADGGAGAEEPMDERLKNIEPKMVELIMNEIMDHGPSVGWDDIAGLEFAKKTVREIIVLPMLRPDIFTGIRSPPKGLLLFGPPGTGKTLIGKCIASQAKSTFFSISASSLTSKWVGEGEKMVRALFAVARINQPAVIFIDEIDSLLSQRSDGEHDASRRIKTEFLVQLDGATTGSDERILVVGATNRPQEIDEAARRRFVKRLYIPLPESAARVHIVRRLMAQQNNDLTQEQMLEIAQQAEGYSGADMTNLCSEAAYGPIRSLSLHDIENIAPDAVRPITLQDFKTALKQVKPSVSQQDLGQYLEWNKQFGSWQI